MMEKINIRLERPDDYRAVERLTFAAFETMELPGRTHTNEHFLARLLREDEAFVPELDFVAELDGEIVSSIFYSKCKVIRPGGAETESLVFGPVSVKPELHGRGIGFTLIRRSLDRAGELGYTAVLIMGHPAYYQRFGFVPASKFNISLSDGTSPDAFMALELIPGALGRVGGTWVCCKAFNMCEDDTDAFAKYHENFLQSRGRG